MAKKDGRKAGGAGPNTRGMLAKVDKAWKDWENKDKKTKKETKV
jgi:hypothetical protein